MLTRRKSKIFAPQHHSSHHELRSRWTQDAAIPSDVTALPVALDCGQSPRAILSAANLSASATTAPRLEPFPIFEQPRPNLRSRHSSADLLVACCQHSVGCMPSEDLPFFHTRTYNLRFWRKRKRSPEVSPVPSPTDSVMATHTETESRLQARATMPPSPTSERKPGFFKRHLGQRRRSSISFPGQAPPPAQSQTRTPRPLSLAQARPQTPTMVVRSPTFVASPETIENTKTNAGDRPPSQNGLLKPQAEEDTESIDSRSLKSGIKWASGFDEEIQTRPRRTSSTGTGNRRSSIYSRAAEGGYEEGVDAGVGSKARRLSVHIPDELNVDECPLEEHFSFLQRHNHKDIGEGGAAVVKTMKSKTAGNSNKDMVYAVKEFRVRDPDEEEKKDYERKIKSEFAIAKSCQHPNVVETFCLCYSKDRWYHVMEMCELGDLNDLINKAYFSEADKDCMFKQLIRGIDFLHSRGIAHRDIKSENLLVSKSGCLKIADFGTGEVFSGMHPGLRNCRRQSLVDPGEPIRLCEPGQVGSKPYMAPEIFQRKGDYDPRAVDVWSCAIVYLSMRYAGTPFAYAGPGCKNFEVVMRTWNEWLEQFPDGEVKKGRPLPHCASTSLFRGMDGGSKRFVMGMLHPDPTKRWTAKQVLESQTVVEFACCQQDGYSDDIKTRQKKALHNHAPPKEKGKFLKAS